MHRHRAINWYAFGGSLVKLQGVGVVVKVDVFSHCCAVCLCCLHPSNDPLG